MISFVIPLYNEEESLKPFLEALLDELKGLPEKYEIIFVDDGSTDASFAFLKELVSQYTTIRVFSFRTNQGKAEALTIGFQKAQGDRIVTLDADLQDRPAEIKKLLEKLDDGYGVVSGWRKNRKDPFHKRLSSKIFNFSAEKLWGLSLHDYNCGLKAYSKEAAQSLRLYGGMHRFIPLIAFQEGFRVTEVEVYHDVRRFGKSKYSFTKIFKDLPDMFTMLFLARYSKRPLHFFGMIGGLMLFIGFLILSYLSVLHFQGESIGRRPLLLFGVMLMLGGLQVVMTGFIAELIINLSEKEQQSHIVKYSSDSV